MLCVLFISVAVAAVYLPVLSFDFTNWDDPWLAVQNPFLQSFSKQNLLTVFFDFSKSAREVLGTGYLPIRDLSVMLDHLLFGVNPAGHHAMNLLYYISTVVLLFLLLQKFSPNQWIALMATLIFAFHPTHVENVAWVSERKSLLSVNFLLLGFLFSLSEHFIFASVAFVFAVWSKSTAIVFFPLLWLIWRGLQRPIRRIYFSFLGGMTFFLFVLAAWTSQKGGMYKSWMGGSLLTHILTIPYILSQYIVQLFYPGTLKILTEISPVESILSFRFLIPVGALSILIFFAIFLRKKNPLLSLALFWFFVALIPLSQIFPIPNRYAERYLYLPSVALSFFVIWLYSKSTHFTILSIFLSLCLCLMTWKTWQTLPHWENCETLWGYASQFPDHQKVVLTNQIHCLRDLGEMAKAEQSELALIHIDPENAGVQNDLAAIAMEHQDWKSAKKYFDSAHRIQKNEAIYENNLGVLFMNKGNKKEARAHLDRALKLSPNMEPAKENLKKLGI